MEDGNDIVRYELCMSNDDETDSDMHAHFYCEQCQRTTCLHEVDIPKVSLPTGYRLSSVNFMLKGVCPECAVKQKQIRKKGKKESKSYTATLFCCIFALCNL